MSLPFELADVRKVTFFKRDELTTDLICCEVEVDTVDEPKTWLNHEEHASWQAWLNELAKLPGFDPDWPAKASLPAFAPSVTLAFQRTD